MTDNYQINKNSKLYQKFLTLKANKPPQIITENQSEFQQPHRQPAQSHNTSTMHFQTFGKSGQKMPLNLQEHHRSNIPHVTIDDIEEAVQMATTHSQLVEESIVVNTPTVVQEYLQTQENYSKQFNLSVQADVRQTNEKMSERRARDFKDRKSSRPQKQSNNQSFIIQSKQQQYQRVQNDIKQRWEATNESMHRSNETAKLKQNIQQNRSYVQIENELSKEEPNDSEYRKKYQKLYEKYEELRGLAQRERKQRQQQMNDKQTEIELIREKYFELRSQQDTNQAEIKRLKQKVQLQSMMRTKYQQQAKQLSLKMEEMRDILQGRQGNLKKRNQEMGYWKAQWQTVRSQVNGLEGQIQKLQERCQFVQSQNKILKRDVANKQGLVDELRKNIALLIEENTIAKDQIYKLTIKSYQLQQQAQTMRGDLRRQQPNEVEQYATMHMQQYNNTSTIQYPNIQAQQPTRVQNTQEGNNRQERRKREFARERTKPERQTNISKVEAPNNSILQRRPMGQGRQVEQRVRSTTAMNSKDLRIQQVESQLQKIRDMKALTGKLRRQKIQLQRELEQLHHS